MFVKRSINNKFVNINNLYPLLSHEYCSTKIFRERGCILLPSRLRYNFNDEL